ncbi:uncharacterized protein [Triticum aestivum]|uniref:uncharacterized protein isoform X5 n=1 Tax=Triticum aestivum TaxID=4565 RepID=UPI001D016753|nr:uncharacterized protein LOC123111182 isoform X5 [Triticum aestivum]
MRRSREALSRSVLLTIGSGPCHSRSSLDGRLFLFSVSGFLLCLSFRLAFTGLALVAQSILPTEVPPTCTKLLRQGGEEKGRGRCGGGWFTGPVALDWHQHRAPAYGNEDPFLGMRRSREALSRSVLLTIGSGPCHSRLAFTGLALVAQSILPTEVPPTCTKLLRQGGEEKGRGRCGGGWFTGPVALDWHQHRAPAYGNDDPFLGMRRSREALSRSVLLAIGSGPCHSRSSLDGRLFLFSVSGFLLCLSFRLAFTGLALVAQSILPTEVPPTCTKLLRQGGEEKGRGRCGGGWFTGPVALDWHQHRAPAYGNEDPFLGMRRSREALSRSVLLTIGSGPCHSRSSLDGRLFLFSVSGFLLCLSFRLAFTGLALVAQSILPTEVPPTCTKLLRQGGEEKGRGRCGGGWFTGPVALDWHQHRAPAYGNDDPFLGMRRSREALSRSVLLAIGSGPCHSRSSLDGRLFLFSVSGFLLCLSFRLAFTGLALVAQSILPTEVPPTCTKLLRQGGMYINKGGGERKREVRWWLVHRSGGTGLAPAQSSCLRKRRSVLGDAKILGGTLPFSSPYYRFRAMPPQVKVNPLLGWQT